ncbi:MAG: DciA family protein [Methylocystis sp.]
MSVSSRAKIFARPLADYVLRELDPLVAARGFSEASLLMCWREIVGPRIARICAPAALQWPPRPRGKASEAAAPKRREKTQRDPATLVLRVDPGFGLEAQHFAPIIIDRVNAHLGWRCVAKITLRQESLTPAPAPLRPAANRPLPADAAARARAVQATEGVAEEGLRAALIRLGERALSGSNGARGDA